MNIQIELWALLTFLIGLLLSFIACIFGFAKVLGGQIDKRLDQKFKAQEELREAGAKLLRQTIDRYTAQGEATAGQVKQLERDFFDWKAELPLNYVRREDYIRGQTVLEAKQDALHSETSLVRVLLEELKGRLKGMTNG